MDWTVTYQRMWACAVVTAVQATVATAATIAGQNAAIWLVGANSLLTALGSFAVNTLSSDAHPGPERSVSDPNIRRWNHHLLRASALAVHDLVADFGRLRSTDGRITNLNLESLNRLAEAIACFYDEESSLIPIAGVSEPELRAAYSRGDEYRNTPAGTIDSWGAFLSHVIKHTVETCAVDSAILRDLAEFIRERFHRQMFEVLKFDFDAANSPIKGGAFAFVTLDLLTQLAGGQTEIQDRLERQSHMLQSVLIEQGRLSSKVGFDLEILKNQQAVAHQEVVLGQTQTAADHAIQNSKLDTLSSNMTSVQRLLESLVRDSSAAPKTAHQMIAAMVRLPSVLRELPLGGDARDNKQRYSLAYEKLEAELGIRAGTLASELPGFAEWLLSRPDLDPVLRVEAEFLARNYSEAARLALIAEQQLADEQMKLHEKRFGLLQRAGDAERELIHYAQALDHYEAALRLVDQSTDPIGWAGATYQVAYCHYLLGRYAAAAPMFEQTLRIYTPIAPTHPSVITLRIDAAANLRNLGRISEALSELKRIIPLCLSTLGPFDLRTIWCYNNQGNCLMDIERFEEAEAVFRTAITLFDKSVGPNHKDSLRCKNNLACVLLLQGKAKAAEKEHRAVLTLRQQHLGDLHPDTLISRGNLAYTWHAQRRHREAELEFRTILPLIEKVLGATHSDCMTLRVRLADALEHQSKFAEAADQARAIIKLCDERGEDVPKAKIDGLLCLSKSLEKLRRFKDAEASLLSALSILTKMHGSKHPRVIEVRTGIALNLANQAKHPEAIACLKTIVEELLPEGLSSPRVIDARLELANLYHSQGNFHDAETEFREILDLQIGNLSQIHPDVFDTRRALGLVLSQSKRYLDAEFAFTDLVEDFASVFGEFDRRILDVRLLLACTAVFLNAPDEALTRCVQARDGFLKTFGPTDPKTIEAQELYDWLMSEEASDENDENDDD